jgi:hypothetical protein
MKSWEISLVVIFYCMIGGAYVGASTHWNDDGGCMSLAPFSSIIYTVIYGVTGLIIGAVLSPVAVLTKATVEKSYSLHKTRQAPPNSEEAHSLLLRPSSTVANADQMLLRPLEGREETDSASLLRGSEKSDASDGSLT